MSPPRPALASGPILLQLVVDESLGWPVLRAELLHRLVEGVGGGIGGLGGGFSGGIGRRADEGG